LGTTVYVVYLFTENQPQIFANFNELSENICEVKQKMEKNLTIIIQK
jgi:hypothetical protein